MAKYTILVQFCVFTILFKSKLASEGSEIGELRQLVNCQNLLPGQYRCNQSLSIDPETQSVIGCQSNHTVKVTCQLAPEIECSGLDDGMTFTKEQSCRYTAQSSAWLNSGALLINLLLFYCHKAWLLRFHWLRNGYDHKTALMLSVFLGMFGIDRFYLGYPALGLLKFCTLGFFFLFHLVDVILIAMQIVGPADGSEYVLDYYGPRLSHVTRNNETIFKP